MRLKDIREESELKQFTVGELIRVTRGTYSLWELELDIIPLKRLNSFCNAFNCSIDYALGFTNTKNYKHSKKEININLSAKRLKEIRKEHKLTQLKLASILNTTQSVIADYEKGRYLIATPFLYTICLKFHLSADYLLGKVDNPKYLP